MNNNNKHPLQLQLHEMFAQLSDNEVGFKRRAFENAASAIYNLTEGEFNQLLESRKWTSVGGIGNSSAKCINEFIDNRGNVSRLGEEDSITSDDDNETETLSKLFA